MKRKLAVLLLAALLLTTCMAMFCGCVDEEPEPREVELELVNPITGDAIKSEDTIELPDEGTPIEVRVKDKETGEYLTDDDLPEMTLKESWHVNFAFIDTKGFSTSQQYCKNWPAKEYIDSRPYYNKYEILIFFDCRPERPKNPSEFKRKYATNSRQVRFYINKTWRETEK